LLPAIPQNQQKIICRFCYSEEPNGYWLSPCKCSGSIKWVHDSCFDRWLDSAPLLQRDQCATCKYVYKKIWKLKPYKDWCLPDLKSSQIEVFYMVFDALCTYRMLRTCKNFFMGRRSLLAVLAGVSFWRLFIMTDRRIMYWTNLFRCLASSVFQITVVDAS
uniref:RING-CH-type domain-containing protein n=1 Tax=Enterobius vermicularis TaxID=51028 RepID=A0A0N4UT39_ENTVE